MNQDAKISFKRNKRRKRKSNMALKLLTCFILLFTISFTSFSFFKMTLARKDYNSISSQYETLLASKENVSKETANLESTLAEKNKKHEELQAAFDASNKHVAHLTFDDGPSDNTLKLLDVLDQYQVKATFFVTYRKGYDEVYKEIVNRGHVLANHTFSHDYKKIYASPDAFINDVLALDNMLEKITGKAPSKIIRFPGGSKNSFASSATSKEIISKLTDLGYTFFDWNVDSADASGHNIPKNSIITNVLTGAGNVNTANILMHDTNTKYTTFEAIPEIINGLKGQGYVFKPLSADSAAIRFIE